MILGYLSFPLFVFKVMSINLLVAIALNIPAYIDGVTQALNYRTSNNKLRLITGLLSGVGQMGIISIIGQYLGLLIVKLMKGEI